MHKDKFVFAQLTRFLERNHFNYLIKKYEGDKYIKSYTCWNQLLTMMFGQLSNRESLRDLIAAMEAHAGKLYHLGIGKSVTRSNLSKANEQRNYRIFEEYATFMISERPASVESIKYSNLTVMFMHLTLQRLICASQCLSGLNFANIKAE